jgi:hypothetical protein
MQASWTWRALMATELKYVVSTMNQPETMPKGLIIVCTCAKKHELSFAHVV